MCDFLSPIYMRGNQIKDLEDASSPQDAVTYSQFSTVAARVSSLIGDGSSTSITVTHNLNSRDVFVKVYDAASPYAEVSVDVSYTTVNTLTLIFTAAPALNSLRVVITGGASLSIGSTTDASLLTSGSLDPARIATGTATDGYVPVSDGAGNVVWEALGGGPSPASWDGVSAGLSAATSPSIQTEQWVPWDAHILAPSTCLTHTLGDTGFVIVTPGKYSVSVRLQLILSGTWSEWGNIDVILYKGSTILDKFIGPSFHNYAADIPCVPQIHWVGPLLAGDSISVSVKGRNNTNEIAVRGYVTLVPFAPHSSIQIEYKGA